MNLIHRRHCLGLFAASLAPVAWAQSSRAVTIIVPQPAGNPSDVFARKMLPVLQRSLGQAVIVENLPGAGGSIGLQKMLNARADGHTLAFVSQTEPILTPLAMSGVRYGPEQVKMLCMTGRTFYALVGRLDMEAADHAELVKQAGGHALNYAHIGYGSMIHLLGEQWSRSVGVPVTHVPYKGIAPLVQDLLGGQVDLAFLPLGGNAMNLMETGKLKVFGVTAPQPVAVLPKVPALGSLGMALRGFVHTAWGGLVVSRSTPPDVMERVHRAFADALQDAEVQAFLKANGTEPPPAPLSLAELERFYQEETRHYQQMARGLGLTPL